MERLLNWKLFPLRHCEESLMENLALGDRLTIMVSRVESVQAKPDVVISVTV